MATVFSKRISWGLEENALWQLLCRKRAAGDEVLDLTESNPTRVGLSYPEREILAALAQADALTYAPSPRGLSTAREAVANYYRERGIAVTPDDIFLTASTSEAYSHLFKLLCDPGDEVLVPRPSYPLFDILASLDAVEPVPYAIEPGPDSPLSPRCRAIVAVHPNNPTGAFVPPGRVERLLDLSDQHGVAVIADEVFLDYPIDDAVATRSFAGAERGLVFVLGGLSKLAALPQMKLAWIAVGGIAERRREAILRLEHIADTYLSVGTPVQLAAPRLLELAPRVRDQIRHRTIGNLRALERAAVAVPEVSVPKPEGGWYTVLRLPAIATSEEWCLAFLEEASVYLHPGDFFGFEQQARVVVSLLPPPEVFQRAIDRVLRVVSDRLDSLRD